MALGRKKALSPNQERFSKCLAGGMTKAQAHLAVYGKNPDSKCTSAALGSCVYNRSSVKERVEELDAIVLDKVTTKFAKTKDDMLMRLDRLVDICEESIAAMQLGEKDTPLTMLNAIREARACIVEQGKLSGFYVEKKDVTHNIGNALRSMAAIEEEKLKQQEIERENVIEGESWT